MEECYYNICIYKKLVAVVYSYTNNALQLFTTLLCFSITINDVLWPSCPTIVIVVVSGLKSSFIYSF